jgi:uncharacterized protein
MPCNWFVIVISFFIKNGEVMYKYLIILFLFPAVCVSKTSLWQISKNDNHLYLGGTIHVLKKEDYPLPVEFNKAFNKSDKLIFEIDIEAAKTAEFGKKIAQMLTYPPGKSLNDAVNEKTLNELKKHLASRAVPFDGFSSYKPSMVVLILTMIELRRMGMVDTGVDEFFYKKAIDAGKATMHLETLDEQLAFIVSMGKGSVDDMILNTINDMSRMESMMDEIKSAWLSGDENKMEEAALKEMMRDYPEIYQSLLVKRNNNWMPHIEQMMSDKDVEMILVGALHLVGKDGLLQMLRNKGYVVKPFSE